jgi:peptidoglycan/LPS O-acetylase OafA/YrhL
MHVQDQTTAVSSITTCSSHLLQQPSTNFTGEFRSPSAEPTSTHGDQGPTLGVVFTKETRAHDRRPLTTFSTLGRIPQLTSLRGLAAVLVVLHHFQLMDHKPRSPLVHLSPHGSVPLFFLLSGFVLAIPYLKGKQGTYPTFFIRRVIRIYCPYLCGLALSVAGAFLFHHQLGWGEWADSTWSRPVSETLVLQHVLLLGNYDWTQYNTAFWSLVQEMRISLCFPALFFVTHKLRTRSAFLLAISCSLACQSAAVAHLGPEQMPGTLSYVPIFICGILLAKNLGALNTWYQKLGPPQLALLWLSSLALFCEGHLIQEIAVAGIWRFGDWPVVLGSAGVVLISLNSPWARAFLDSPLPRFMGRISYSLYLVHGTVLFTLKALHWGCLPTELHCMVYLVLSLLLATGFCIAIDEPFMRMARSAGESLSFRSWAPTILGIRPSASDTYLTSNSAG